MEETLVKENVGGMIKRYRKSLGLTQIELANIIGLNQRQIAMIETGKSFPMLSTMTKLAEVFHCSVSDFFGTLSPKDKETLFKQIEEIVKDCDVEELKQIYSIVKTIKLK